MGARVALCSVLACAPDPSDDSAPGGDVANGLSASVVYTGEFAGNEAAYSSSSAGDFNGDGYADFLVGAFGNEEADVRAGAAYLVLGGPTLASSSLAATIEFTGESAGDIAGTSVGGAGDVNGDGYDDLLVGSYGHGGTGAAYLLLGEPVPDQHQSLAAALEYSGEISADLAGQSVGGAGDVNGDGFDDFLVGACNNGEGGYLAGAAYLVLGGSQPRAGGLSSAVKFAGQQGDQAGWSVAGAGDVDGDGYADILVGANGNLGLSFSGAAYLSFGGPAPTSMDLVSATVYTGEAGNDQAGISVAGAQDVNGDGYDDFLIGAFRNSDGGRFAGAAYLVLGGDALTSSSLAEHIEYTGEAADDNAGASVAGAGDVDGDGYADMLVGAPACTDAGPYAGAAYLVLGASAPASAALSEAREYPGEADYDNAGASVAGAGDVNGDGNPDLLVGAYLSDLAGMDAGAAYLILDP